MADNVAITPGAGATIAADDVGGVLYQRIKLDVGGDGVASPITSGNPLPVSGTFWQATQPVSGTITANAGTGTFAVSAASLPLPSGAATAAKQPALGTAGAASVDVITVQGIASGVAQPVSGTVTANAGTGTFAVSGPLTDAQLRATAVPVSGTFWQATQPVSGAVTANAGTGSFTVAQATAANLNATVVGTGTFAVQAAQSGTWNISNISGTVSLPNGAATSAKQPALGTAGTPSADVITIQGHASGVAVPVTGTFNPSPTPEASATFRGRASTFRTPGRAGTTGQKIFALHNATGSTKVVHINQIAVDLYQTVVKAITVAPPTIRVHRFTAVPTNGTALTKVSKDTALASNASITVWGDASADGTSSATALTVTIPANSILTQEFAARFITAAGYEMMDRAEFLDGKDIVLRALEGIVVELVYTAAGQNPITDMWIVSCDWWEI